MNPEIKALWVAALRSGEYEQGTDRLRTADDKYCCLGVLCDLAVKVGAVPEPIYNEGTYDDDGWIYPYSTESTEGVEAYGLSPNVQAWAGINDESPSVTIPSRTINDSSDEVSLAEANDYGMTFQAIAALIEEYL